MNKLDSYRVITVFLIGFIGKTAIIFFLFYAYREGALLENIARSFIFSLIVSVIGWPIMWFMEHRKEKSK